jgi:dienelactone hydrolase
VFILVFVAEVFRPVPFAREQVYEVDIVAEEKVEDSEPVTTAQKPEPESAVEQVSPEPSTAPEPTPEPPPEPPSGRKTPARKEVAEPQSGEAAAGPDPVVEPAPEGVKRIPGREWVVRVPRKEWNKRLARWSEGRAAQNATLRKSGIETAEESKAFAERLQRMRTSQRKYRNRRGEEKTHTRVRGAYGFAAFAQTAALESIAYGNYTTEDYVGHYSIHSGGYLSIVDARERYGDKLVLYDHVDGLTRTLVHERGKIYSYGPEFGVQQPNAGSVTFMPKKEGMEHVKKYLTGHLFWLPEDPPMRYCKKVLFEPRRTRVPVVGEKLDAFVLPQPGTEPEAAVVWHPGPDCMSVNATMSVARTLAIQGVAVMGYAPRGCEWPSGSGEAPDDSYARTGDLLAAVKAMRRQQGLERTKVGVWGEAGGAADAILAAKRDPSLDFVVVSVVKEDGAPPPEPPVEDLKRVEAPVLFVLTGGDRVEWKPFVDALSGMQGGPEMFFAPPRDRKPEERKALNRYFLTQSDRFGEKLSELVK